MRLSRTSLLPLFATAVSVWARVASGSNCAGTSVGFTPLNDLGTGFYQGEQGGLYAGGSNQRPSAHDAAGLSIANAIASLDTFGNPDPNGRVVLISIGMSNATQEFSQFVPKAMGDPQRNPHLLVVDCAVGGMSAEKIVDPSHAYWDSVTARLRRRGSAPAQVQAVWLKEAIAGPRGVFPASKDTLRWYLARIARLIHQKMPNAKLCYLTSRIYAGYATSTLNPEPYAYESGFAVKDAIGDQIGGADSLNFDPANGPIEAPWMAWGPYLWADGLTPRSDGLAWPCSAFVATDGTHPAAYARKVVSDSLLAFFKRDATTRPWFLMATASVPLPPRAFELSITPNPASRGIGVHFTPGVGLPWKLDVVDAVGRRIARLGSGIGGGVAVLRTWSGAAAPGTYWMRLQQGAAIESRRFVLLGSP